MKRVIGLLPLLTAAAVFLSPTLASADCGGSLNYVGQTIGLGPITQRHDDFNREIRKKSSDESLHNQLTGSWNHEFRSATRGGGRGKRGGIDGAG
jgi:hypothetical protein